MFAVKKYILDKSVVNKKVELANGKVKVNPYNILLFAFLFGSAVATYFISDVLKTGDHIKGAGAAIVYSKFEFYLALMVMGLTISHL
jgi:hypothetical protein